MLFVLTSSAVDFWSPESAGFGWEMHIDKNYIRLVFFNFNLPKLCILCQKGLVISLPLCLIWFFAEAVTKLVPLLIEFFCWNLLQVIPHRKHTKTFCRIYNTRSLFFSEIKFCRGWFRFLHFPTWRIFALSRNENKQTANITRSAFYFRFALIGLHLTAEMEVNSGVDLWIQWLPGRLIFSLSPHAFSPLYFPFPPKNEPARRLKTATERSRLYRKKLQEGSSDKYEDYKKKDRERKKKARKEKKLSAEVQVKEREKCRERVRLHRKRKRDENLQNSQAPVQTSKDPPYKTPQSLFWQSYP